MERARAALLRRVAIAVCQFRQGKRASIRGRGVLLVHHAWTVLLGPLMLKRDADVPSRSKRDAGSALMRFAAVFELLPVGRPRLHSLHPLHQSSINRNTSDAEESPRRPVAALSGRASYAAATFAAGRTTFLPSVTRSTVTRSPVISITLASNWPRPCL